MSNSLTLVVAVEPPVVVVEPQRRFLVVDRIPAELYEKILESNQKCNILPKVIATKMTVNDLFPRKTYHVYSMSLQFELEISMYQ